MKQINLVLILIFVTIFSSCDPKINDEIINKKSSNGVLKSRNDIPVVVHINGQRMAGIDVRFGSYSSITNENGVAKIPVNRKRLGNEGHIYLVNNDIGLDTSIRMRIEKPTVIYLKSPLIGTMPMVQGELNRQMDMQGEIEDQLKLAKEILDDVEGRLDDYVEKNPNTAMENYYQVLNVSRDEMDFLKKEVANLTETYADVIKELEEGEIVDLSKHERRLMKISRSADKFFERINKTKDAYVENQDAQKDALDTDVFFALGEFSLDRLTEFEKSKLDEYVQEIWKMKDGKWAGIDMSKMELEIRATGYTDGVPVSNDLYKVIRIRCQSDNYNFSDPNECLSYLRADGIVSYIASQVTEFYPSLKVEGNGSILANGSKLSNASLRRCDVSFTLIPKKLTKNIDEDISKR